MLERIFSHGALHTGAHLGYFSGLSMMIPILSDAWEHSVKPWLLAPNGFLIAIGLIILSVFILAFVAGSISKLIRSLGWMMLIPGIIAMLFAGFGEADVYNWADNHITGFATAEPAVHWLVEHSVPSAAYLGGVYVLVGMLLLWTGRKMQNFAQFV